MSSKPRGRLSPDEWAQVRDIFDAAVPLDTGARDALLDQTCRGREALRHEVTALLAAHDRAAGFLETPACEAAAELFVEPEPALAEGRALGPYIIRGEIGRGGMGIVYLADDTRLSRRVALKACGPTLPRRREQLRREARAAAALTHPGIATVYALEELEGELYLASEYVPGATLRELLAAGPLDAHLVIDIATQLARALAAAHAHGVIHGDLSPANVVRTPAGVVKVLDFGVARVEAGQGADEDASRATRAAGTPGYMAPEQIAAGDVTFRSDLFAFGVMVHELAAGERPSADSGTPASAVAPDSAPLARRRLDAILRRCLQPDPSARYGSTFQLVADLERIDMASADSERTHAADDDARLLQPRWWWRVHQALVSIVYVLVLYPAWLVRPALPAPWGTVVLATTLATATAATTLRLHLLFTSRFYPAELKPQRRRSSFWIHVCEGVLAAALLAGAVAIERDHQGVAMLFVAAAVGLIVASVFIEPTTSKAAFGSAASSHGQTS